MPVKSRSFQLRLAAPSGASSDGRMNFKYSWVCRAGKNACDVFGANDRHREMPSGLRLMVDTMRSPPGFTKAANALTAAGRDRARARAFPCKSPKSKAAGCSCASCSRGNQADTPPRPCSRGGVQIPPRRGTALRQIDPEHPRRAGRAPSPRTKFLPRSPRRAPGLPGSAATRFDCTAGAGELRSLQGAWTDPWESHQLCAEARRNFASSAGVQHFESNSCMGLPSGFQFGATQALGACGQRPGQSKRINSPGRQQLSARPPQNVGSRCPRAAAKRLIVSRDRSRAEWPGRRDPAQQRSAHFPDFEACPTSAV